MKLLRHGLSGQERPGALDADGVIRDLGDIIADLAGDALSPAGLDRLRALDLRTLPAVAATTRFGPPIGGTRNFVGVGLNYADHAAETGAAIPAEPILFLKSLNALAGPDDAIQIPAGSHKTDWEVELAIVIGTTARRVSRDDALSHVAGYAICNDVSEREWQLEHGGSWDKGKGFDGFGPLGPWLVTADEILDVQALDMELSIDGTVMQLGSTATMIFPVVEIVHYVSQCFTLYPGDVITTGTPPGVGIGRKPPVFLRGGETIELAISGLGRQRQRVYA